MTKKILFLAALATTLSFAACNKDTDVEKTKGSGVEGYLTVKLSAPQTRTSTTGATDNGTPEESKITDVTVVFTDDAGIIKYVKNPGMEGTTNTTKKFTVEIGTYKLYALVNNPSNNAIVVGDNIEKIITKVTSAADAATGYSGGSFFMVNARHNGTANAGVDVNITAANIESNPLQASVNVDRVAVKVMLNNGFKYDHAVTGTWIPSNVVNLHVDGFAMLNVNKQFNMIQKWGNENVNGSALVAGAEVLQTPLYPGTGLVMDQYYRNISEFTDLKSDAITDLTKGANLYTQDTKYTIENRPTIIMNALKLTAGMGETTGVIFRVIAQDASKNSIGTFYSYKNKFYTSTADIEADGYFPTGELTALTIPQVRAKGIKVYEDGVMYYTYFILDPNDTYQYKRDDASLPENYYGVFRNSVYQLGINGFNNIGDDVPGGGKVDPNEPGEPGNPPIDKDEAYIEVAITINPWVLNTIGINF